MEENPSLEEWEGWKEHRVTQAFHRLLRKAQTGLQQQWAAGMFNGESKDEIHILNSAALGEHRAYERLVDMDFEQFIGALEDDK
jgi:hypothetical protein